MPVTPPLSAARSGWTLALLALGQAVFALDLNIVFVALPEIGTDLGFPGQTQQLVVSAYVVFAGGFLLLGGRACDLLGRRRVFVAALALYGLSSLAGGLARSPEVIVGARIVQGVGGALLGGVLTEGFGWPAVFFVNVPLAAAIAVAAVFVVPPDPARTERRRFDLPGALTVTAGATLLVFALVQAPERGWADPWILGALAAALVLLAAFALVETRSADPLMPFRLFRNRSLSAGAAITFLYMATFGVLPYFLTVLLRSVHGYSAPQTGLAFLVPSLAIAAGTQLGERLTTRAGLRSTLLGGFALGAVGTAALAAGFDADAGYLALVPGLVVSGVGQGVVWTAMWIAAAAGTAAREQGIAGGAASTTMNLGNAIGLALFTAVADAGTDGPGGEGLARATADGGFLVVLLAAAAVLLGLLLALVLRPARADAPAAVAPDCPLAVSG
ncbi:MFS transporter [Kitasatospora sp. NPDC001527]|uniref:MFS transporter n=1 Tax=Kitasatospora sp. NPDC001527 TaxID=3154519 RepID=UPI00332A2FCD